MSMIHTKKIDRLRITAGASLLLASMVATYAALGISAEPAASSAELRSAITHRLPPGAYQGLYFGSPNWPCSVRVIQEDTQEGSVLTVRTWSQDLGYETEPHKYYSPNLTTFTLIEGKSQIVKVEGGASSLLAEVRNPMQEISFARTSLARFSLRETEEKIIVHVSESGGLFGMSTAAVECQLPKSAVPKS